jgi:hypothetical protein
MAGIDFDRQIFATPNAPPPRQLPLQALAPALFVLALGAVGLIGYKIYNKAYPPSAPATAEVELLRQQLSDMQKRLDQVEKHRRPTSADTVASQVKAPVLAKNMTAPKVVYQVIAASKLPAVSKPIPNATAAAGNTNGSAMQAELLANHEAWQATTDRLADVVSVVGTQQGEISETREAVNQILAQSKRRAISFELQRGSSRMPVGPLTLQLKSAEKKSQRYSVCIYVEEKCIELKDRAVNEVVVFRVAKESVPLEFVATKILRDQILGYVEVPVESHPSMGTDR